MPSEQPIKAREIGMHRATGQGRDEWFAALDAWGARDRPYPEIAEWLTAERGISQWWAQKLIVEYQQSRGVRAPGIRPDGTFTATASRTLAAPAERVFEALVDAALRERWIPGASMRLRTSRPGRTARFDWEDGSTRVSVSIAAVEGKSQAAVVHAPRRSENRRAHESILARAPDGAHAAARESLSMTEVKSMSPARRSALLILAFLGGGCAGSGSAAAPLPTALALGTWGADGAGVIVSDTLVHVHVGCTKGDFRRPETLDADGRFNVAGTYLLRAYPVAVGPLLPARFAGVVRGSTLTLSVAINDTVQKTLVALGPVTIVLAREPTLGICPICVVPTP